MTDTTKDIADLREVAGTGEASDWMTWPKVDPAKLKRVLDQLEAERQRADDAEGKLRSEVMNNLLTTDYLRKVHRKIAKMESEQVPVAYFAAAPDYGWDMFKNKEDAIATCQAEIDAYRDCRDDGWDDNVQRVCWGVVLQKAEGFDQQGVHTSNSHHAYQACDYSLQPELFATPQKPIALPGISELIDACDSTPAVRDVHVWDLAISEVKRLNPSLFSDKSAAVGIVKDGE